MKTTAMLMRDLATLLEQKSSPYRYRLKTATSPYGGKSMNLRIEYPDDEKPIKVLRAEIRFSDTLLKNWYSPVDFEIGSRSESVSDVLHIIANRVDLPIPENVVLRQRRRKKIKDNPPTLLWVAQYHIAKRLNREKNKFAPSPFYEDMIPSTVRENILKRLRGIETLYGDVSEFVDNIMAEVKMRGNSITVGGIIDAGFKKHVDSRNYKV